MDYGTALTIIATTLISIAIIAAVLRLIARFLILKVSGWDDFCVLGAVVTAAGMLISINLSVRNGLAKPVASNGLNTEALGKIQLAIQVLYIVCSGLIKASILLLYSRIFPTLRIVSISTTVLVGMIAIAFIFTAIFQCKPVGGFWVRLTKNQSSCISLLIFWCDVAVVFLVSNIWITLLPVKALFKLQLSLKKRVMAFILLASAGLCTVVSAAVRLAYVIRLYKRRNDSLDVVPIYICSVVEVSTALFAISIPVLRLVGKRFLICQEQPKRGQRIESH